MLHFHSISRLVLISLLCALSLDAQSQVIDFAAPVDMRYEGESLEFVLSDLTERYNVGFSYSRQIVPVQQPIYFHAAEMDFGTAMESMLGQTQVIFGVIGNQIVLSVDVNKQPIPPDLGFLMHGNDDSLASAAEPRDYLEVVQLQYSIPPLRYTSDIVLGEEEVAYDLNTRVRNVERMSDHVRAQMSLVPPLQLDSGDKYATNAVNVSLNLLAGVNESVEGVELGGLVNVTTDHLTGMQAAGLVNVVNNNMSGFQMAGLVNVAGDQSKGAQAAGLVNVASDGVHAQIAGLTNYSRERVNGQIAGLFNIATDVDGAQIAGLVNVGKNVRGTQIGLFNFCDSTGGVPIGLVSFVRKRGYHSIEFAVEDAIDYNLNLRLGVRGFYNILHVGLDDRGKNWSIGYGLGTSIWLAARNFLQFELMARQISEGESWTSDLNLLTQFKLNYDFALGKNIRVALGPSFNVATSRLYNEDTGMYGTQVPRYTMWEHTYEDNYYSPLNVKYWVGLQLGIRFGSADFIRMK